ncbi:hypothetical protein EDB80DRAFT_673503 [Ilyonectria destructans]|nr:hypothetical protein EDB80DRAFT_673503 [Ilyonectria destructans]
MRHSFGPGDETTYCAVRNLLQFTQGLYRKAYDWRVAHFGDSDSETIECLYALAVCRANLQKLPQAEEAYQQLAYIRAAARLSARRDRLQAELRSWGLEKPAAALHLNYAAAHARGPSGRHAPRNVSPDPQIVGTPKLVSSEAIFFDPGGFATIRIWKDPTKLVAYYFAPRDTRIVFVNMGSGDWQSPQRMRMTYLYPSTRPDPVYLLVAPGETMFRSAKSECLQMGAAGSNAWIDLPNSAMIEYLQSKGPGAWGYEVVAWAATGSPVVDPSGPLTEPTQHSYRNMGVRVPG